MGLALLSSIGLHLEYDDQTLFGSMISGQLEARLKRGFQPLIELLQRDARNAIQQGPSLLGTLGLTGSDGFLRAPGTLRDDLVCPAPGDTRPATLRIDRPGTRPTRIGLPESIVRELAAWLGEWQRGAAMPTSRPARDLWIALSELGCFERPSPRRALRGAATFVGHATVLLSGPHTSLLVDPFLLPSEESFPPGYRPLDLRPTCARHGSRDPLAPRPLPPRQPVAAREGHACLRPRRPPRVCPRSRHGVPPPRVGVHGRPAASLARGDDRRRLPSDCPALLRRATHDRCGAEPRRTQHGEQLPRRRGGPAICVRRGRWPRPPRRRPPPRDRDVRTVRVDRHSLRWLPLLVSLSPSIRIHLGPAVPALHAAVVVDDEAADHERSPRPARHSGAVARPPRRPLRTVAPRGTGNLGLGPTSDRPNHDSDDHFDPPPEVVVRAAAARSGGGSTRSHRRWRRTSCGPGSRSTSTLPATSSFCRTRGTCGPMPAGTPL